MLMVALAHRRKVTKLKRTVKKLKRKEKKLRDRYKMLCEELLHIMTRPFFSGVILTLRDAFQPGCLMSATTEAC